MFVGLRDAVIRVPGDSRPLTAIYQDHLQRIISAELFGFDFVWFGEHHFMPNQWNPSSLMLLAALSQRTSRMRLGTSVLLTPFYNPLRVAEDVAQLDVMSNGRVDLILGTASITGEFETFGIPPSERFGRTWEIMGFLERCYSEAQFDHAGKYYQFKNVRMTTQPVQTPFPLWFGGFGPQMLYRAGRSGVHLQTGGIDPRGPFGEYLKGLAESGHAVENKNVATSVRFVVVDSQSKVAEARENARVAELARREEYSPRGRDLAFERARQQPWLDSEADSENMVLGVAVGTPDQVLKSLEPRWKAGVATHLETFLGHPAAMELTGREILPTLKSWGRAPVQTPAVHA
jgi:alkanesulfonate monooxygenase SsuD/methylene tetrahydromethanopterin reductase-like flavin-dependent oxidoreductase (luciferase family)